MEEKNTRGALTLKELEDNIQSLIPDIILASEKPEIENPFKSNFYSHEFSWFEKSAMFTLGIILVPIRLTIMVLLFFMTSILSKICVMTVKEDPPIPFIGVRRFCQCLVWFTGRFLLFVFGFINLNVTGKLASQDEAPIVVVAPHTSFLDGLFLGGLGTTFSPVGRHENNEIFLVGSILQLIQPITVDRTKKNSKQQVVKEINRRSKGNWPHVLLFPEGTTTNHQAFITFKPGAFYPGLPVQPIILKYDRDVLDYSSWTWIGPGIFKLLLVITSRLFNHIEIEILPVYKPSQKEIDDPFLYGRNVREVMAKAANVPVTDHSYEDCRLMLEAQKLGLPMEAGLVEYYKLSPMIGMNCECMMDYLRRFARMDKMKDGKLDINEFCDYLNLPLTDEVLRIFNIYDIDKDSKITFREYLFGFTLISMPFNTEENIAEAFSLFDPQDTGSITYENLAQPLKTVVGLNETHCQKIFNEIDSSNVGKINKDTFREFCLEKPEYALLFIHFRKLTIDASLMTVSKVELRRTSVSDEDTEIIG